MSLHASYYHETTPRVVIDPVPPTQPRVSLYNVQLQRLITAPKSKDRSDRDCFGSFFVSYCNYVLNKFSCSCHAEGSAGVPSLEGQGAEVL